MAKRLGALDIAFLSMDTKTTPTHVAALQIFELPKGQKDKYINRLYNVLRNPDDVGAPWNLKVKPGRTPLDFPSWVVDEDFDLDFHVRRNALPKSGSHASLCNLVSRLHSRQLDKTKPLWECHLIEGLKNKQFAIYMKIHHAMIDGMGGVHLMQAAYSTDPKQPLDTSIWANSSARKKRKRPQENFIKSLTKLGTGLARGTANTLPDLSRLFVDQGQKSLGRGESSAPPAFAAPKSVINQKVGNARRFDFATVSLSRVKALSKFAGVTVNDIVLAICAGGLRKYLEQQGQLPAKPLVTSVPVSVRRKGAEDEGNNISYIMVNLATNVADPKERLEIISSSSASAKEELSELSADAAKAFAAIAQSLTVVLKQLRMTEVAPPPANVVISNVPGPRETMYLGGAKLLGNYPVSVIVDGQGLNMTVHSYVDSLDFGLIACRDAVPGLDKLCKYMVKELDALEKVLGFEMAD